MDFRHLRAFIAVAEESSVTRAAERLHISQPPLSRHIHQLEEELGVQLFVRHRQGVTLTDTGRRLLAKARALDSAAAEFFEAAGRPARDEKVRVGVGWGLWDTVNKVRLECAKQHAPVTIDVTDAHCAQEYNELLKARSIDLAFGRPPFDTTCLNTAPLFHERLVAVISEDNPLAARKSLRIRELGTLPLLLWDRHLMPFVYDKILDVYARAGVDTAMIPTPGAGPHNHAGMMLVASGQGAYLCVGVPQSGSEPVSGIAVVPISDPDATVEIDVAWRKGEASPIVLQFLAAVWRVFPQDRRGAPPARTPARRAS